MSATYSERELEELKDAFKVYDEDDDGQVASDEAVKVMRAVGICLTEAEAQEIIGDLDIDRDGECDLDAFINLCQRFHGRPLPTAKDLKEAFLTLDTDGNGKLTAKELKHALCSVGETLSDEEVADLLKQADKDGDGEIDYTEFVSLLTYEHPSMKQKPATKKK